MSDRFLNLYSRPHKYDAKHFKYLKTMHEKEQIQDQKSEKKWTDNNQLDEIKNVKTKISQKQTNLEMEKREVKKTRKTGEFIKFMCDRLS